MKRDSMEQRILMVLDAYWPGWVPAPELAKISLQYSARIFALRKAGWEIANKIEIHNGVKHGFFRLGSTPIPRSAELRGHRTPDPPSESQEPGSLFDDLPCRHVDLG
jgi:hypothetical protein